MKRRQFITVTAIAATAGVTLGRPLAARAQRADKVYRIGYLSLGSLAAEATRFNAFRAGLAALGVDVIVTYATRGVSAAKRATTTIPIVFATVGHAALYTLTA